METTKDKTDKLTLSESEKTAEEILLDNGIVTEFTASLGEKTIHPCKLSQVKNAMDQYASPKSRKIPDLKEIAEIIEGELGYTNGWSVNDADYFQHCMNCADKIIQLLYASQFRVKSLDLNKVGKKFDELLASKTKEEIEASLVEQQGVAENLSFEDYCQLIGAGPFNEPAFTIYKCLKANGWEITRR